ncbi:YihY/virulence factor BrkB family protein [Rhodopseudomonas sp. BR0M22]|uniref:YihY/virulence factor BrkB family protein n=1 Tax=Rhodopseudomonas sp. BR0M22 TaxID=2269369 RepID=UPI0013DFD951|nr:YihY/virulence factor BrkB family protein [Rhodopseudomonas sp. BR0M22]NEW90988.1 YihY/virulence factor BrkB family protein [Rhodopseudomonas sp. BR0M22]
MTAAEPSIAARRAWRASERRRPKEARRQSDSPWQVLSGEWKAVATGTYARINDDRLFLVAAGVVFYWLLGLFPAITALVSSYALFADAGTISGHLAQLSGVVPAGTYSVIEDQVGRVLANGQTRLGFAFLISLSLALWSANGGVKAIIDALNAVYDVEEQRGFIKLNAFSLLLTCGALFAVLASIGLVIAAPIVLSQIGLGSLVAVTVDYGRWPALAALTFCGLALLYRTAANRPSPPWRWVVPGSLVATLSWLGGSAVLSYYLANFADYNATYGSLGAAIGLMIWMWMTAIVVLVGGEFNAAIEACAGRLGRADDASASS